MCTNFPPRHDLDRIRLAPDYFMQVRMHVLVVPGGEIGAMIRLEPDYFMQVRMHVLVVPRGEIGAPCTNFPPRHD